MVFIDCLELGGILGLTEVAGRTSLLRMRCKGVNAMVKAITEDMQRQRSSSPMVGDSK